MSASVELTIPSRMEHEKIVMSAVAELARMAGMPIGRIDDLRTAVAEACLNAIEHGNGMDPDAPVVVLARGHEDRLIVDVIDQGRSARSTSAVRPAADHRAGGRIRPRGMGLPVIHALVDEVDVVDRPGGGRTFRMVVYVGATAGKGSTDVHAG